MMHRLGGPVSDDQSANMAHARRVSAYDCLMRPLEAVGLRTLRRFLVAHARGNVLEVGVGTGTNLPFYPKDCVLTAIDTDIRALEVAQRKANLVHCHVTLVQMDIHQLGFTNQSFDAVVVTLVLCAVSEPKTVLGEISRVLRPGGQLLLIEHVLSSSRLIGRLQDWLNSAWHRAIRCNLNRDTARLVQDAGFQAVYTRRLLAGSLLFSVYEADEMCRMDGAPINDRRTHGSVATRDEAR